MSSDLLSHMCLSVKACEATIAACPPASSIFSTKLHQVFDKKIKIHRICHFIIDFVTIFSFSLYFNICYSQSSVYIVLLYI